MTEAMIFDAIRTPRGTGKAKGSLHEVAPVTLLSGLLRELQARNDLDTSRVDDVVMGVVTPVGEQGSCVPKIAALAAGWDWKASGVQLNRFCASGLEAVNLAAQKVRSGWEDIVVAGGVESMSRVPMGSAGGSWSEDPALNMELGYVPQGIGADLQATLDGFSRDDVDAYAMESQQRAAAARASGKFARSIMPVKDAIGLTILAEDEFIKPDTDMQKLGALQPSFAASGAQGYDARALRHYPGVAQINHVHTAGNSSGIVDGAAAILIANETKGAELGLKPRARVVATAVTGTDPVIMLTGPTPATHKVLAKAGMTADQIDLFEVNEAFASVPLRFMHLMDVPHEKVNVNGGAIAMGHPLGATGAILVNTLLDELEARQLRYGLATLCVGAGMGIATIIERL